MVGNASGCFKNGVILTSLSRNFFTDLRKASVGMPKRQFASSISQSANYFLSSIFYLKRKLGEGTSIRWSKVTLLFSLTCSVDFFMLSSDNKPAFPALIPPSFTIYLSIPLWQFSDRCNPILAVRTGESMRIPGSTPTLSVLYRKCSHMKQAVHTKSSCLWMSEENFLMELSRSTFYDYIIIIS